MVFQLKSEAFGWSSQGAANCNMFITCPDLGVLSLQPLDEDTGLGY